MRHEQSPTTVALTCFAAALAILLSCRYAYPSADMCAKDKFTVEINIGHDKTHTGAISACGKPEYEFNRAMAQSISNELQKRHIGNTFTTNHRTSAKRASKKIPSLLISIHHDSVQPQFLSIWTCNGIKSLYSDDFRGYSIFYSAKYGQPKASLNYANILGTELRKAGFTPTQHHAMQIPHENRQLMDATLGIYLFDLRILKHTESPAVLLECGVIVNRQEEQQIATGDYRQRMATAVANSVQSYCSGRTDTAKK